MNLAPVAIFTFKRLDTLKETINSLQLNKEAKQTELFIFSDGGRNRQENEAVSRVRDYLETINGFKSISIMPSPVNKGLATSIITGVSDILEKHDSIIVLEDDLVVSTNFLAFMNGSLDYYKSSQNIISVSGYNMNMENTHNIESDVFFTKRSASWGWATWKDRWTNIDWEVKDFCEIKKSRKLKKEFNKMGSDMFSMLKAQQEKRNNSWAIRFCYHQFRYNLLTVYPFISKVKNIGFNGDATHTNSKYNRFETNLEFDSKSDFFFTKKIEMHQRLIREFRRKNGFLIRLKSKLINIILNVVC